MPAGASTWGVNSCILPGNSVKLVAQMPIDLQELGRKLKKVRAEILQLSLEQVSGQTGIAHPDLQRMEAGLLEPTGDQILILADVYDEPFQYFISNERSATIEKADELYRRHGAEFTSADRINVQAFLRLCRTEHELEAQLGSCLRVREFTPTPDQKYKKGHGQDNADRLRKELGLGVDPIDDAFHLARTLGCHVFRRRLGNSNISGVFFRHDEFGRCVLVNYDEDVYRQNFSVLHELGHAIFDADCNVNVTLRSQLDGGDDLREVRANAFASRLLVPLAVLKSLRLGHTQVERRDAILGLCRKYRVNFEVGLIALKDVKRIGESEYKSLKGLARIPREEKVDPELSDEPRLLRRRIRYMIEHGLSTRYVGLCFEAFRRGRISVGKLAESLLVPVDEIGVVAEVFGQTLGEGV